MDSHGHNEQASKLYISNRHTSTPADDSSLAAATLDHASARSPRMKATTLNPPTPFLLGLPLELRLQICKHFFHSSTYKCQDDGFLGCRCGESLCSTNRQLFIETRHLYLNHRRFVYTTSTSCLKFLNYIGGDYVHLREIAISFKNLYSETLVLKEIFHKFRASNTLRGLQLEIQDDDDVSSFLNPPIYYPIALPESAAAAYDLSFRPSNQPLGDLKSLRALTVLGHPGTGEVEEALFRLSRRIDKIAQREGKALETQHTKAPCTAWFYRVSIEDDPCPRPECRDVVNLLRSDYRKMLEGRRFIPLGAWGVHE